MNMSEYRVHLCIGPTLFPPNFVPKSECDLYMLLEFFKFENAFKSRENDPDIPFMVM